MEKTMKLKIIAAITALCVSSAVMAESYQAEISAEYIDWDAMGNAASLVGEFHFKPVETANKPLAEAAFLQKSSNVFAAVRSVDFDFTSDNNDVIEAGVEYYVPNSMLYVAAEVIRTEYGSYSNNDWCTSVGVTPVDGLLIKTNYCHDDGYDANLQAKYVTQLAGETALNLEASYAKSDDELSDEDSYSLGADFYFTRKFSLGATYEDEYGYSATGVRSRYFFNEQISLAGAYVDSDFWGDSYTLSAAVRF